MSKKLSLFSKNKNKILLVLLPYSWAIVFFFLPFILLVIISFSQFSNDIPPYKNFSVDNFFEIFENYRFIFREKLYFDAYLQSIKIAFFSTLLSLSIGYPLAYGIAKSQEKWRPIMLVLVIIPFFTSSLVRVYSWMSILKTYGILNNFLIYTGLIKEPLKMLNNYYAVIIGITYSYLPFMVLPVYFSLEKISPYIIEAAEDLGAKPIVIFWNIILPLSINGIITGSLMVFVPSIGEFVIPDILGGTNIMTIGKVIWSEFFLNRDWPVSSALSLVMIIIIIVPMIIIKKKLSENEEAR